MGTPNSHSERELLRNWLCNGVKPTDEQVEANGLSIAMLERVRELIKPQFKYLRSKPIEDFNSGNPAESSSRWAVLEEHGLTGQKALKLRDRFRRRGCGYENRAEVYLMHDGAWVTLDLTSGLQDRQQGRYEWRPGYYVSVQAMLDSEPSLEPADTEPVPLIDLGRALYKELESLIEERRRTLERQGETLKQMADVLWR